MPNNRDIIITPEMLNGIAEIDAFNGAWTGGAVKLSADDLRVMRRVATIESVGSSNRIEGNRMTDVEIEALFANINRQ